MDKTEVVLGEDSPLGLRIHSQFGEGKLSRLAPNLYSRVYLRGPEKIWLLRRLWRFWHGCSRVVHVIATHLMLGAISTANVSLGAYC
jgi:hypothetical protein